MSSLIPGTYRARVTDPEAIQYGYTRNGHEHVAVPLEVIEGEAAGQSITWFGNFGTDKGIEIAVKALRACGWEGDDIANLVGIEKNEVEIVLALNEYEGKSRLQVQWINRPGDGKVKLQQPMNGQQRTLFGQRVRAQMLAGGSAAKPAAAPADFDQIPF